MSERRAHLDVGIGETRVRFKRLTDDEIAAYLASGEWEGKAGAYGVQGRAGGFVTGLNGSYSGVVGLPLYETRAAESSGICFTAGAKEIPARRRSAAAAGMTMSDAMQIEYGP